MFLYCNTVSGFRPSRFRAALACALQRTVLLCVILAGCHYTSPSNVSGPNVWQEAPLRPETNAAWAKGPPFGVLPKGIGRWFFVTPDKTTADLFRFDFQQNPRLRMELYDQDQDDAHPFDNKASYFDRGVGAIVKHLNDSNKGTVIVACNGPFFSYTSDHKSASHIGPVVLNGKAHYNFGQVRWAFGVKYIEGKPEFKVVHSPDIKTMQNEFDFGAMGLQCLIKDGRPLKLQPFPQPGDPPLKQPVPSTDQDVGHIPV